MPTSFRRSAAVAAFLILGACSADGPTANTPEADLAALAQIDPALGAEPGQASELGLTMDPAATYNASVDGSGSCAWSASSGRIECAPVTRGGLTITRSIAFADASGAAQQRRDDDTRSSNTRVTVTGTTTTPRGTMHVARASDLTRSGLGRASTQHTLNGRETSRVSGTVTGERGSANVVEESSSRTDDVVVPVPAARGSYPISGSVTRSGRTTATRNGTDERRTVTWSETVTFNGTSTVQVSITRDARTVSCTRDLVTRRTTACR